MTITPEQIGEWLAGVRDRKGLSQAAAGRAIEKDSQQISKWERAVSDMGASNFLALVALYEAEDELADWVAEQRKGRGAKRSKPRPTSKDAAREA